MKIIFLSLLLFFVHYIKVDAKNINSKKPKIVGIVSDYLPNINNKHNYTTFPIYSVRNQYIDNFVKICSDNNILFIIIPNEITQIERIIKTIDAFVFIGGGDIDSKYFNQKKHPKSDDDSIVRTEFELKLFKKIIAKKKPIFAICRGMQLANIALGGDIIQDIPSYIKTTINHQAVQNGIGYFNIAHKVRLINNSMIKKIINRDEIGVNSNHHQALGNIGKNLIITAFSEDQIPEAIELKNYPSFFLGVQWHPEFLATENDKKIIKAFCENIIKP